MKRVVVTGALGFIGFSLCEKLVEEGVEVIALDHLTHQYREIYEEKLLSIGRNALFSFVNTKLESANLGDLLKGADVVFHLAAATDHDSTWDRLQETIENNVRLTKEIVQSLEKQCKLVFASTIQVYGERTGLIKESTPTNPITPYAVTKQAAESIILQEGKRLNKNVLIVRLPTVYGPWQRLDMAYQQLICAKLFQLGTKEYVDRSTLDVLYIDDVATALFEAGKRQFDLTTINLSSGRKRLWFKGIELLGGEKDKGWSNPLQETVVSNEQAKKYLGFSETVVLQEGIKRQVQHITKYKELYRRYFVE